MGGEHRNKYQSRNRANRYRANAPARSRSGLPARARARARSPSKYRCEENEAGRTITWQANDAAPRKRRRNNTAWDVPALGYEHLSPVQYKAMQASGQIALRILPDTLPTGESASIATVTRPSRRLYVGNIPFNTTDDEMRDFFNVQIQRMCGGQENDGNAVLTCQTNLEKNFAFLELRSMDETTVAISFDGINYRGQSLKIRRPHDYHSGGTTGRDITGAVVQSNAAIATVVPDTPHKIYIGGLPSCLNDDQVKELLMTFGHLRGFNMVKNELGQGKGYAFCEYMDASVTEQAIAGLNGMQLGERKLTVQRSLAGVRNLVAHELPVLQVPGFPVDHKVDKATEVLCLLNMVMPDELLDDAEYEDIRKDIKEECAKFGRIRSIKIPRPFGESPQPGCGKVYVRYDAIEDCQKALKALSGRRFSGRIVMTTFYDPDRFKRRDFQ